MCGETLHTLPQVFFPLSKVEQKTCYFLHIFFTLTSFRSQPL